MSKELGLPLRFPGNWSAWSALHEGTDAELLGQGALWAITSETARNQIFNINNGDNFRWRHMWRVLAEFYDMPAGEPQPMRLVGQMEAKESVWNKIVDRYSLIETPFQQIANWEFLDICLNFEEDVVLNTVKIRQAGFGEYLNTDESLQRQLQRLRGMRLIP
jgi:hypothetical protein